MPRRAWLRWLLYFACATLFGLFFASQSYLLYRSYNSKYIPLLPIVLISLAQTWTWFVLLPGILWMSARFPLERRTLARSLPAHLIAAAAFALLHIAIRTAIAPWIPQIASKEPWTGRFMALFFGSFHSGILGYWAILLVSQAVTYYRRLEERELRASQLETRLAHAQLQALRLQLQPHFLFNALHAISALVHKDAELADRMI